jgi:hypothetical protein
MSADPLAWTFGAAVPTEPGWYAVLDRCRDGGAFPNIAQWDGRAWFRTNRKLAWCGPFPSPLIARQWAQDHTPE